MKRIIALYGSANRGKSAALKYLINLLERVESFKFLPVFSAEDFGTIPYMDQKRTFNIDGLTVCVATAGDNKMEVDANVRYFEEKGCDIAVTATRGKGATVRTLEKYADKCGAPIVWRLKSHEAYLKEETMQLCNCETAEVLLHLLRDIAKG
jgi:hypothetical protein